MKVTMIKAYSGKFGRYRQGHIETVPRETGKWLIANGYAVESRPEDVSNQDRFVSENRPSEQPQVIIMPYPVRAEEEE